MRVSTRGFCLESGLSRLGGDSEYRASPKGVFTLYSTCPGTERLSAEGITPTLYEVHQNTLVPLDAGLVTPEDPHTAASSQKRAVTGARGHDTSMELSRSGSCRLCFQLEPHHQVVQAPPFTSSALDCPSFARKENDPTGGDQFLIRQKLAGAIIVPKTTWAKREGTVAPYLSTSPRPSPLFVHSHAVHTHLPNPPMPNPHAQ